MSLVGREVEQARIERLLANARKERSGALGLRGAAGMGKSVLLDHAVSVAEAEHGMRVVRGAGVESDSELAYGGLHQLLFPHLDRVDALPAPQARALRCAFGLSEGDEANRFLISAGTLSLLADLAEDAPLLCVVDDMQWLDQGSVEALLFAARRFVADPIAVLFAVRETAVPFGIAGVEVVDLPGLAAPEAARLLDGHAPELADRVRSRVLAESGGNPLAIIELGSARSAVHDVDESDPAEQVGPLPVTRRVQETFRHQIVELPESTQRALLVAAADTAAPLSTILHVIESLGGAAGDLAPAERDRLVRIDSRITFRHPLVRAAAYQDAPLHRRIEVHRAYAEALHGRRRRPAGLAPGRRLHRADEAVAAELEGVAERAWHRAGAMAVCAAYERAGRLSADRELKARRIARASQASFDAGKADAPPAGGRSTRAHHRHRRPGRRHLHPWRRGVRTHLAAGRRGADARGGRAGARHRPGAHRPHALRGRARRPARCGTRPPAARGRVAARVHPTAALGTRRRRPPRLGRALRRTSGAGRRPDARPPHRLPR
ncbi:AAA family ATPase [Lentzea guizhouensis]|uniref:AAA family ATPase n=1 Tax=Lentzea guizhouensis TaxID=1586287 RepID=UPI000A60956B|nr:AAA family ATPase [Lentzea guizhouensis]